MPRKPRPRKGASDEWRKLLTPDQAGAFAEVFLQTTEALVVILDRQGRIVVFNRACEELTGWAEDEIAGKPIFETLIPQEQREGVREIFDSLAAGDFPNRHENDWVTRDDGRRWIAWANSVITDPAGTITYVVGTGIDITERRRVEEALRVSEERYRLLFEDANDAIFIADTADGRLVDANPAALELVGQELEDLRGRSVLDLHPEDQHREILAAFDRIEGEGLHPGLPFDVLHRDGRRVPVEIKSSRVTTSDGRHLAVGIFRDLTDRRRAEEDRRQMEAQVQHVQKLESLGILAGGIAHDFNNLLMVILGHADLAGSELEEAAPAREHLAEIEGAARRAADLCKQMLAYAGKGRFVVRSLDLQTLIEEMLYMLQVSISKKAVLKCHFADVLPAIEADPSQIRQVVMNLVINASEAIGERSGVISVSTGVVDCDEASLAETWLDDDLLPGTYVSLEVADTGCGMEREVLGRIFDPFYTTKFAGRGLGMAAVLGIIRGHRGAVTVSSEPGRGTTFKVLFPACAGTADTISSGLSTVESWTGSGTVLLVDDEETIRVVGRTMLEKLGFEVLLAEDGRKAVEVYREHGDGVVLVLLDLTMPHVDGAETFRELRRLDPEVKVVMSSGYNEQEVTQRFCGKGIAGFIQKPYQLKALTKVLREALEG